MENLNSTTITWDITAMDCYPQADGETDVVFTVHWTCSGAQTASGKTYNGSVYSTCSFGEGTPSIPYDQVTEQEVLNWCWAGGVDKDATEAALAQNIAAQKNPVTATGTPW